MKFVLKSWVKIFLYTVIILTMVITLMLYILNYYNFGIIIFEIFFVYMLIKASRSYYFLENDNLVEHSFKNVNYDISSVLDVESKIVYNTETHSSKNFSPMRVDVIVTNSESIKVSNLYVNQSGNTLIEYLKQTKLSEI